MNDPIAALLTAPAFWFGALIFLLSQWGKFSEFSTDIKVAGYSARNGLIQIRPRDMSSGGIYGLSIVAFLFLSFIAYTLFCLVPPGVVLGWLTVSGSKSSFPQIDLGSNFPLVVAAALVGLTQPVPGFDRLANLQKDIFHQWIGLPQRIVSVALSFAAEMTASDRKDSDIKARLKELLSEDFITKIDEFADIVYYRDYLRTADLENPQKIEAILAEKQRREQTFLIRELVLVAAIATARASGGGALGELAKVIGVQMPESRFQSSYVGPALFLMLLVGLALWALISLGPFGTASLFLMGVRESQVWPATPYTSAQYLLATFVPISFAGLIVIASLDAERVRSPVVEPFHAIIGRNHFILLGIFVGIFVYDYLQAVLDRAVQGTYGGDNVLEFVGERIFLFSSHALVATTGALIMICYIARGGLNRPSETGGWFALLLGATGTLALINAYIRIQYQYPNLGVTHDFAVLLIVLTMAGAASSFFAINLAARHLPKSYKRSGF